MPKYQFEKRGKGNFGFFVLIMIMVKVIYSLIEFDGNVTSMGWDTSTSKFEGNIISIGWTSLTPNLTYHINL